jgi:hypothetical protein
VRRIRELQTLLGLNLEEIAAVLRNEDRLAEIRQVYHDERTSSAVRRQLVAECLTLQESLRATVEGKRAGLWRNSWPTLTPGSPRPGTSTPTPQGSQSPGMATAKPRADT